MGAFFQNPNDDYLYDEQSGSGWVTIERSETAKGFKVQDIKEFTIIISMDNVQIIY